MEAVGAYDGGAMEVIEIQSDFDLEMQGKWIGYQDSEIRRYEPGVRSEGLHVSEIIREIATGVGILKREDSNELDWTLARYKLQRGEDFVSLYPAAIYRVALGLAWEEWLGARHPEFGFHGLGELERDGIIGSLDGLQFDEWGPLVHEIKLTWKSSRSDRESAQERFSTEWLWPAQCKSYCYLASLPGDICTRAMLHVMWVNGNYKGSGPEYRTYLLKFMPKEILTTWKQMQIVGKRLMEERCRNAQ